MIVDFKKMEEERIENFRGGNIALNVKMFTDKDNKIMKGRLEPSASIGLHKHAGNSEIILITKGYGQVLYEGDYIDLKEGDVHYCANGKSHSLINNSDSDLEFFAVVGEHNN